MGGAVVRVAAATPIIGRSRNYVRTPAPTSYRRFRGIGAVSNCSSIKINGVAESTGPDGSCVPPGSIVNGMIYPGNGAAPYPASPIYGITSDYQNGQVEPGSGMVTMCRGYDPASPSLTIQVPAQQAATFQCPSSPTVAQPVLSSAPSAAASGAPVMPGVQPEPAYAYSSGAAPSSGFDLSSVPWWGWALLAAGGLYLVMK